MTLERIEITPFAVIVGDVVQQRRTGALSIVKPPLRKTLYWSQGELVLVTSSAPEDSLGDFLSRRGVAGADLALALAGPDSTDGVAQFHESGVLSMSQRQTLLREWLASRFLPLFSLDEGTAAFTDEPALDPEKRVFLQSTPALLIEGIRSITNGLLLRRSLGDLKREIGPGSDSRFDIDSLPLTEPERKIAASLTTPMTVEAFLKQYPTDSGTAARVAIAMLVLGLFTEVTYQAPAEAPASDADMQRDLELLAAIGAADQRSLRAIALSRQLPSMDHYQVLDIPRAANRTQVINAGENIRKRFDPNTYPAVVRDAVAIIVKRIDEASLVLRDAVRRQTYDRMLQQRGGRGTGELQQRIAQRSIAEQNFARARELSAAGDYYGAIVLLKQAVEFAPDHAEAWHLLGACQERNPKWRRDAAESFQRALSLDPNYVDCLISLGDLYRSEGLASRAQSCYEDVLKIAADNQQAKSRLQAMKKR